MNKNTLRDRLAERRLFVNRTVVAALGCTLAMSAVALRLAELQVVRHADFTTKSEENRVRIEPAPPTRGLIYDRNGVLLAENVAVFRLDLVPERIDDMDQTLARLSELVTISEEDIEQFHRRRKRSRSWQSIPLRDDLNEEELARLAVNSSLIPGMEIVDSQTRVYPQGASLGHAVGYVGRISDADLGRINESDYQGTHYIGKVGIERSYEKILHGRPGYRQLETNAQGRRLEELSFHRPTPGEDLYLTIDVKLQKAALEALDGQAGSVVAIAPRTGDILALASLPNYDPNLFVNGIDRASYAELRNNKLRPLFNRAVQGQYPPGSTLKPVLALAGLDYSVVTPSRSYYCPGYKRLPNTERRYRDWKRSGHLHTDMHKAIVESCDVYFYELALELGIDRMHEFLGQFSLGQRTGVDMVGEMKGLLPSRQWKRAHYQQPWFPGETLINGIGQGFMMATPLQLAQFTAIVANRGQRITPRLVQGRRNAVTEELQLLPPQVNTPVTVHHPFYWDEIVSAMVDVVHGPRGTAKRIAEGLSYTVAGKTGTAQVFGLDQDSDYDAEAIAKELRDHALFIAFAPAHQPEIALAVIVENGGSGGKVAAPIARKVLEAWLNPPPPAPAKQLEPETAALAADHSGHPHAY